MRDLKALHSGRTWCYFLSKQNNSDCVTLVMEVEVSGKSMEKIWIFPLIEALLIQWNARTNTSRAKSLYLCFCVTPWIWCDILHLVTWACLKRSWQELWGRRMEHTERREAQAWEPPGPSAAEEVSILGFLSPPLTPCDYVGGWVDHNNMPLLI